MDALGARPEQSGVAGVRVEPRHHQALPSGVVAGQSANGNPAAFAKDAFFREPGRSRVE